MVVSWNRCTKHCGLSTLNNRNILPHSPGSWKFKIKPWAGMVHSKTVREGSAPGLSPWLAGVFICSSSCVCTWCTFCIHSPCLHFYPYFMVTSHIGDLILTFYLCKDQIKSLCLQIRSHSEVLRIKISVYELVGQLKP